MVSRRPRDDPGNRANRQAGALVGLHYHLHQADYWYVPFGTARVVLHDLREGGPTDGNTLTLELSGENHHGVYIRPVSPTASPRSPT